MKLVKGDMKKKLKGTVITQKKIYIIGVIVFVILIVGFVGWTIYESKNGKEPGQEQGYNPDGEGGDEGLHAEKEGDGDFIEDSAGSDKKPSGNSDNKDKDNDDNKKEDPKKDDDDIEFGRVF